MRIPPATRSRLHGMLDALLDGCDSGNAHGETIVMIREVVSMEPGSTQHMPLLLIRGVVGRDARIVPDLIRQIRDHSRSEEPT